MLPASPYTFHVSNALPYEQGKNTEGALRFSAQEGPKAFHGVNTARQQQAQLTVQTPVSEARQRQMGQSVGQIRYQRPTVEQWLGQLQLQANYQAAVMKGSLAPASGPSVYGPQRVTGLSPVQHGWQNNLKSMLGKHEAVVYALNIRTFGAYDRNHDGQIAPSESGTFLSAIPRLDELQRLGVNTLHLLPINPPGQWVRLGEEGSLYAPEDYHRLNPEFSVTRNPNTVVQEAREFIQACHDRGIHVMVDIPSCASYDLAKKHPELIALDEEGNPKVPHDWVDILMFVHDSPALREYYQGFFDLMVNQVGVDGFRVDVVRARPPAFWKHFTDQYPELGWLAETYTKEDASPLENIPADDPKAYLEAGMDAMYGQLHIFHQWPTAKEYFDYLLDVHQMFQEVEAGQTGKKHPKTLLGSFLTHDDPSLMTHGGPLMYMVASGMMATQPWSIPYVLDGFTTGYEDHFDIFNRKPRPTGAHPEIGRFMAHLMALRNGPFKDVLTQGTFTPIQVKSGDREIIVFARSLFGKTLLVVANKDVNSRHEAKVVIPGLKPEQALVNLAPEYGQPSSIEREADEPEELELELGPGRFHLFAIDTPALTKALPSYDV